MNTLRSVLTACLALSLLGLSSAQSPLELRVTSTSDDAEEFVGETSVGPAGSVYLDSSDLELTEDQGTSQVVGLRFAGLELPAGATVSEAYLQFSAKESGDSATALEIAAEASNGALSFQPAAHDISSRALTNARVSWSPAPWTEGSSGEAERSPNLAPLVQEVLNRPGWQSGNAIVFVITGSGRRTAWAFDGGANRAPRLVVTFEAAEAAPPEPATPAPEPAPEAQTPAEPLDKVETPSTAGIQPGEGARLQQARYSLSPAGTSGLSGSLLVATYNEGAVILTLFLTGSAPQNRGAALRLGSCEAPGDALLTIEPTGSGGYSTTLASTDFASLTGQDLQLSVYENPQATGAVLACGEVNSQ